MRVQYGKSFRIVQYLALVIIALPLNLGAQLFEGLIDFGLEVIKAVDDELLEITALSDAEENRIGREIKKRDFEKGKGSQDSPERYKSLFGVRNALTSLQPKRHRL